MFIIFIMLMIYIFVAPVFGFAVGATIGNDERVNKNMDDITSFVPVGYDIGCVVHDTVKEMNANHIVNEEQYRHPKAVYKNGYEYQQEKIKVDNTYDAVRANARDIVEEY